MMLMIVDSQAECCEIVPKEHGCAEIREALAPITIMQQTS